MPEVVNSGLAEVGEDIRAWFTVTFSHQVTVDTKNDAELQELQED